MDNMQMIIPLLSEKLREYFLQIRDEDFKKIQEIRLRANRPLMVHIGNNSYYLTSQGSLLKEKHGSIIITINDILDTLEMISDYSLYAYEEELKNGYITVNGGHRVGIVGKAIVENKEIKTLRYISGLNIRIAHEVKGCSNVVLPYLMNQNSIHHTLIVSPPKCGKTTLLRDIIRQLSNGYKDISSGLNIGVVDERSEIAGCYKGIPQKDVGIRTDVLDACPKADGMMMLLRSMSPDIIAVDEIGSKEDLYAIEHIINAGVKLICTVHGYSLDDIKRKPVLNKLLDDMVFGRIVFLSNERGIGTISSILDENTNEMIKKAGSYYVS